MHVLEWWLKGAALQKLKISQVRDGLLFVSLTFMHEASPHPIPDTGKCMNGPLTGLAS